MISALFGSFFRFFKQPTLLFPGIMLIAIQTSLWMIFFNLTDAVPRLYYEIFVLNLVPQTGFLETILLVVLGNFWEFVFLAVLSVFWVAASLWMFFGYTNIVAKKEPPMKGFFDSLHNAGKILGLSVFFGIIFALFFFVALSFVFLFTLEGFLQILGLIGLFLLILGGIFLYFKLIFLPLEFFSREEKIGQALKKTFEWSSKNFVSAVVFVLLAAVVSNSIIAVGAGVAEFIPVEIAAIAVIFLALSFGSAFFGLAVTEFYFSKN